MTAQERQAVWRRAPLDLLAQLLDRPQAPIARPVPLDVALAGRFGVDRGSVTLLTEALAVTWEDAAAPSLGPLGSGARLHLQLRLVVQLELTGPQIARATRDGWLSGPDAAPTPQLRAALEALTPPGTVADIRVVPSLRVLTRWGQTTR